MGDSIMNLKDRILNFQRFALTNSTGLYNEDSMTAQQLNIVNANKIKECLVAVDDLSTAIENMKSTLKLNYNGDSEELELTLDQKITAIKEQVNSSYVCIFNEDAMTNLELAGHTAKAVNECLKAVNMLSELVLEVNKIIAMGYVSEDEMLVVGGDE